MSSYAFYFIGIVLVVFLVGFVGFYAYRLGSARKKSAEDPSARLGQLLSPPAETTPTVNGAPSTPRARERGPGLRAFTHESVFLRRDRTGEVSFQIGEKPTMPLRFLLDAKARSALGLLAERATADFGGSWAILAAEDEEGWLTVTRLF
ncbi:MAG: hypothetical protein ACYC33_10705 [Thermoleophilia bacterium]